MGDHYEVLLNNLVILGHDTPLENFKQYLQDIYKEFDQELTKTIVTIINNVKLEE